MMNLKQSKLISVFSVILLLISIVNYGCFDSGDSSGGGAGGIGGNVILPLKTGNTWTHTMTTLPGSSIVIPSSTLEITNIGGVDTFKNGTDVSYNYYLNYDDGLYHFGNHIEIFSGPQLFIKYPCSAGDSWEYNEGTYTVLSTSASVTVDAGTFECIEYYFYKDTSSGKCEHYEYWCPGIGQILQENWLNDILIDTIELTSYSF